jgi:hypothetical protein
MLFFLDMGKEIGFMKQTASNSTEYGKKRMHGFNGNAFAVGKHTDGRIEIRQYRHLGQCPAPQPRNENWER